MPQNDDTLVIKTRIAEGNWSTTGWDHDDKLAMSWVEDIEDRYDNNPQRAIDKVFGDLITQLEFEPKKPNHINQSNEAFGYDCQNRAEDIEFLTVELARLIAMRNNLFNQVDIAKAV